MLPAMTIVPNGVRPAAKAGGGTMICEKILRRARERLAIIEAEAPISGVG
jgi:hypothetical protein